MNKKTSEMKKNDKLEKRINLLEEKQIINKKNKKVKMTIGITIGALTLVGVITTCAVVFNKNTITIFTFKQVDYINFKKNIINEINNKKLTFESLKKNILYYSKDYLFASEKNVSSIIEDVSNVEQIGNNISFEILLKNIKNHQYICEKSDLFFIKNNKLFVKFLGIRFEN